MTLVEEAQALVDARDRNRRAWYIAFQLEQIKLFQIKIEEAKGRIIAVEKDNSPIPNVILE